MILTNKKNLLFIFVNIIFLFCLLANTNCYADNLTPEGIWKTIDDETGKPRSIVQIWQDGAQLKGKIIKIFYRSGESEKDVCVECTGTLHNQPFLGMTILWSMKPEIHHWGGGKILDPHNGKIYRCIMTLSQDGQQLNVRGYIGLPLIGRTQTWIRQNDVKQKN